MGRNTNPSFISLQGFGDYSSKVVRFSLLDFSLDTVEVLDLSLLSNELKGFAGGFSYGAYAVFVPYQNGMTEVNFRGRNQFSILTRVDMNNFAVGGIKTLDIAKVFRKNTPDYPDSLLRGFAGGFASGSFMYLVPHFNGMWHGKMVRIDTRDFDVLSDLQMSGQSTDIVTGFKGVQEVDLEKFHGSLVGFSGGFIRQRPPPVEAFYRQNLVQFNYATNLDVGTYLAQLEEASGKKVDNDVMPDGGSAREGEEVEAGAREGEEEGVLEGGVNKDEEGGSRRK